MKKPGIQEPGLQAIHELRCLANAGDIEAIAAIRDVALYAIDILQNLTLHATTPDLPDNYAEAGKNALKLAKESRFWPLAYDVILERRNADMLRTEELKIGSTIGKRLAGKGRGFSPHEHTGFADDLFDRLDAIRRNPARHLHYADAHPELAAPGVLTDGKLKRDWRNLAAVLEKLSKDTLPAWQAAAFELCREECLGDWSRFPWPECVASKASKADADGSVRGNKSAVKEKILAGLKSLIP